MHLLKRHCHSDSFCTFFPESVYNAKFKLLSISARADVTGIKVVCLQLFLECCDGFFRLVGAWQLICLEWSTEGEDSRKRLSVSI